MDTCAPGYQLNNHRCLPKLKMGMSNPVNLCKENYNVCPNVEIKKAYTKEGGIVMNWKESVDMEILTEPKIDPLCVRHEIFEC